MLENVEVEELGKLGKDDVRSDCALYKLTAYTGRLKIMTKNLR